MPYMWIFSPGENFRQLHHLLLIGKIFIMVILSSDCIEDSMATFTANLFCQMFLQYKVAVLGEIFFSENFTYTGDL